MVCVFLRKIDLLGVCWRNYHVKFTPKVSFLTIYCYRSYSTETTLKTLPEHQNSRGIDTEEKDFTKTDFYEY